MLPQVNYRVPNMRFLRDKLVVRPTICGEGGFESPQQGWKRPRCHWMSLHQPLFLTPCPTGGGSQERDDLLPLHPVLQKPDVRRAEVGKSRDPSPRASLPRSASPAAPPFPFSSQPRSLLPCRSLSSWSSPSPCGESREPHGSHPAPPPRVGAVKGGKPGDRGGPDGCTHPWSIAQCPGCRERGRQTWSEGQGWEKG